MQDRKIIIGIAGNPGSGKTAIAKYLAKKYGFFHFEGSDYLRKLAEEYRVDLKTREDYSNFHRRLQQEKGQTVLADHLLGKTENKLVFSGIRSTYNAQKIKDTDGIIIALDAPVEVRYARIDHTGLKYAKNLHDFRRDEEAQYTSADALGADLSNTMNMADVKLDTSKALSITLEEVDSIMSRLQGMGSASL